MATPDVPIPDFQGRAWIVEQPAEIYGELKMAYLLFYNVCEGLVGGVLGIAVNFCSARQCHSEWHCGCILRVHVYSRSYVRM